MPFTIFRVCLDSEDQLEQMAFQEKRYRTLVSKKKRTLVSIFRNAYAIYRYILLNSVPLVKT